MEARLARLAPLLRAGDLVQLDGELGAGKTTLTRGLGAALDAREPVTTPLVLAREHLTASGTHSCTSTPTAGERGRAGRPGPGLGRRDRGGRVGRGEVMDADRIEVAIERLAGGDPLAEDAPRVVRIAGVGERWADLVGLLER
ncbi:MAG: tRNA (adenosine(37)-N6)-threonylcarbamoyltransferase complex ATPase subunit type 1 TsaE [Schumannella sp.]